MFFIGIFSIQCKLRRDRPTDTQQSTGRSRSTCWSPLLFKIGPWLCSVTWLAFYYTSSKQKAKENRWN